MAAAPGNGFALVTFSPSVDTGNAPVISYTVTASSGAKATISAADFAKFAYVRIAGVPKDRPVTFTAAATNAAGTSGSSLPSFAIIPSDRKVQPPSPPSRVSAQPGKNGEVSIHFQNDVSHKADGVQSPITAYEVMIEPNGRKVMLTGRNVLTLEGKHTTFKVISGLKPGTYTFRVSAVNEAGPGEPAITAPVTLP